MINQLLKTQYDTAIQKTQNLILEDIDRYLEGKETFASLEMYLREREVYITQIWLNTWLNTATSHIPYSDKKQYLTDRGFDITDLNKKMINRLFQNDIRTVNSFDYLSWLQGLFVLEDSWKKRYVSQRERYIKKLEKNTKIELERKCYLKFTYYIEKLLDDSYEELFLYIRYLIGSRLAIEIERNGIVLSSMEVTFEEYITNEMDMPYNQFYFLEDRTEAYEELIFQQLQDYVPSWLRGKLPSHLLLDYDTVFHKPLSNTYLEEVSNSLLREVAEDFLNDLLTEYVIDLEKLLDIPFDIDVHKEIMEKDVQKKKQKEAEDLEEQRQRKEQEARMIEDIFGQEYFPRANSSIRYILHVGETNTGKTHHAINRMKKAESGLYLAPLRLLALEIYERLNEDGTPCSLKTGEEEKLVEGANHQSSTVEMFHEKDYYEVLVIDEAQLIADKDRGFSWYRAITKANAKEVHIICSLHAKQTIIELIGEGNIEINEYVRDIPLHIENTLFKLDHTKKGDALVCFSRRGVLETASFLQKKGLSVSVIYGSMPPETRKKQMQRFINGETTVIVSTDAIGMGLNLPIRRIVFLENDKFDGTKKRFLSSQEVKQIAGRAGRKGIYEVGRVAFSNELKKMTYLLEKKDEGIQSFTIAPTSTVIERFQRYSNNLGLFFYLWGHFKSPTGTKKATLADEMLLYEMIMDTMVEARMNLLDLFHFLRIPFSVSEPTLRAQWKTNMEAIVENRDLPEPKTKNTTLEELELSYKSIGLHLLFLYRLDKRTEAYYWERWREDISDQINERLKTGIKVKSRIRSCVSCGNELPTRFKHRICNDCFYSKR
ncbi:helicase-related protein [Bacillus sp. B1-b2]|uniref:helicase-related protein n=1 Tax=Bacillus sp. B1-b2 TaxID=2653201 RepID=UPI001D024A2E|nr:helicase-related protein [Bacillus sp. B1-b2]